MDTNTQGAWAEALASEWLSDQGLALCTTNYQRRLGEIDLIFRDELSGTWVFVEVKYRQRNALVAAIEAISPHQQKRLRRTATLFLQRVRDTSSPARIDVVTVTPSVHKMMPTQSRDGHQQAWVQGHHITWIQNALI